MAESKETAKPERHPVRRTLLIGLAFIAGFVVLGVIAIQVWEYSNSVAFCSNFCHDVHPEEIEAFQDSYHASIKCVECHMGRVGTLHNIVLKASHFRHLPEVIFDRYDRPLRSETMRPPNESCELCHWPPAFHGDTVRQVPRFLPDENNTALRTYLILKTAAGERTGGLGVGIHWHILNQVEFVTNPADEEQVPWVRTTLPDGRTVEYVDVTSPMTADQIAAAEKDRMDCVDCHNRVGHPFPAPEDLVDQALVSGALDPGLPYAKKEMTDLLTTAHASQAEAIAAVGEVKAAYIAEHPDVAVTMSQEIDDADRLAQEFLRRLVFEEPGVTWHDFPDEIGHESFAGCFRCHDGKHMSEDGTSIRLHCNICHSIPLVVSGGSRPPEMPVATVSEPASHHETNFMADHRFQATEAACGECHGEIEFGADDSSFCANSACHGRSWPEVELDAAFPHPIALEGAHANVWCHNCHEGVRKPEYVCANCHESPQPHFGEDCEGCHSPTAWEDADLGDFVHPIALEGAHAQASCLSCHAEQIEGLEYVCANCHQPPVPHFGTSCEGCHTPTSFGDATFSPELHPVPLEGAHAQAPCESCHQEGQADLEFVCANCHEPPPNHLEGGCRACHTPEGFVESASSIVERSPKIPHDLAGREDCSLCHATDSTIEPAPSNHKTFSLEQCGLCHKPGD